VHFTMKVLLQWANGAMSFDDAAYGPRPDATAMGPAKPAGFQEPATRDFAFRFASF
jgi:hypothetical protein